MDLEKKLSELTDTVNQYQEHRNKLTEDLRITEANLQRLAGAIALLNEQMQEDKE